MKKEYTKIREQFQWAARKRKSRAKINNASKGRANDSAEHGLSETVNHAQFIERRKQSCK